MQNLKKYRDMAMLNARGQEWFVELTQPEVWQEYIAQVKLFLKTHSKGYPTDKLPEELAREILVGSIYHIGYAGDFRDKEPMVRWARRLRQESAGGEAFRGIRDKVLSPWLCPWEMVMLDNFLECIVRPRLSPEPPDTQDTREFLKGAWSANKFKHNEYIPGYWAFNGEYSVEP